MFDVATDFYSPLLCIKAGTKQTKNDKAVFIYATGLVIFAIQ
jgi:hypothetical protein